LLGASRPCPDLMLRNDPLTELSKLKPKECSPPAPIWSCNRISRSDRGWSLCS